jgi:hypothetical protein
MNRWRRRRRRRRKKRKRRSIWNLLRWMARLLEHAWNLTTMFTYISIGNKKKKDRKNPCHHHHR